MWALQPGSPESRGVGRCTPELDGSCSAGKGGRDVQMCEFNEAGLLLGGLLCPGGTLKWCMKRAMFMHVCVSLRFPATSTQTALSCDTAPLTWLSRYLQHSVAGQCSPVKPHVLSQHHGAGPRVHAILRVQHLKHTAVLLRLRAQTLSAPPPPRGRTSGTRSTSTARSSPPAESPTKRYRRTARRGSPMPAPRRRPIAGGDVWRQAPAANRSFLPG